MTYQIVLDSASDILTSELNNDLCQVKIAPLVIKIGQTDFVDDENLDPKKLLEEMSLSKDKQTTSCPSPDTFINLFKEADYTFCITINTSIFIIKINFSYIKTVSFYNRFFAIFAISC